MFRHFNTVYTKLLLNNRNYVMTSFLLRSSFVSEISVLAEDFLDNPAPVKRFYTYRFCAVFAYISLRAVANFERWENII